MQDMNRVKILSDILNTVSTINGYYNAAPEMHKTPMQKVYDLDNLGVRPGTRMHKMTPEEEEQLLKDMAEDDAAEEAERQAEIRGLESNRSHVWKQIAADCIFKVGFILAFLGGC